MKSSYQDITYLFNEKIDKIFSMRDKKQKTYYFAIDALRTIAILGVIFIHTSTKTIQATANNIDTYQWALFFNQVSRFAVPLFFLLSGFVLELNYSFHTNYFAYLKKRFSKILIPYIFWSIIYFLFVYKTSSFGIGSWEFFNLLLQGNASYQLYFIPTLLIFYIFFPLIHSLQNILHNKLLLLVLCFIQIVFLSYDYYVHPFTLYVPIKTIFLNFYVFLLGTFAVHHSQTILSAVKKWKWGFLLITIVLAVSIYYEGRNNYLHTHNYLAFYSQWRPSILFYTLFISTTLYYFFSNTLRLSSFIKLLARLSFFVFFIHVAIIEVVWRTIGKSFFYQFNDSITQQIYYDPLFFLVIAVISFLIAFLASKVPHLTKITG